MVWISFKLLITFVIFWLMFLISSMDEFACYEWHSRHKEKLKKAQWSSLLGVALSLTLWIWSL